MYTRIKICGITNTEDARAACDYGADALGFIFVPESPRYVGEHTDLPRLLRDLPPFVSRVAVRLEKCANDDRLEKRFDAVQFYRNTLGGQLPAGTRLIQVFRVRDEASLSALSEADPEAGTLHLDTYHKDLLGGSGETFDWSLARAARERTDRPIMLAGGLTPDNVAEAIAAVRPYAVDVSSGVECEPGRKDHDKLRRFIRAVREADRLLEG